jgi:hypothetical protein
MVDGRGDPVIGGGYGPDCIVALEKGGRYGEELKLFDLPSFQSYYGELEPRQNWEQEKEAFKRSLEDRSKLNDPKIAMLIGQSLSNLQSKLLYAEMEEKKEEVKLIKEAMEIKEEMLAKEKKQEAAEKETPQARQQDDGERTM